MRAEELWCGICFDTRTVLSGYYLMALDLEAWVYTGEKECPGCDGTGVSPQAQRRETSTNE